LIGAAGSGVDAGIDGVDMSESRTFLFMPESAFGPTNNCIGIGNVLLQQGHRVVFAAESSWRGKLAPLGFEEELVDLAPPPDYTGDGAEQDAGQFWKDFVRATAPEFRKPTIEQLDTWVKPVWQQLIDGARYCEPQLREIIARVKPDVIIEDNVVFFPALATAGVPFVRIVSCNPLEIVGENIAPVFSGYSATDRSGWAAFRAEYDRVHRALWTDYNEWVMAHGAASLPDLEFMPEADLNLYVFPEEADYIDARPLGSKWHRIDSSIRETDGAPDLPPEFLDGSTPLVYFSLGSLGSADVDLMRRIIAVLAATPYRYIVSKGPLHAEIDLAANMYGAEFLPQTRILPLVDLVITHGGNNTTTEALHFGKPMILLPLFWDQYDNAQRMDELGFGVRLNTYGFEPAELVAALDRLLGDAALRTDAAARGERLRERAGVRRAAALVAGVTRQR
jgi:MGT family glycosyltransferase